PWRSGPHPAPPVRSHTPSPCLAFLPPPRGELFFIGCDYPWSAPETSVISARLCAKLGQAGAWSYDCRRTECDRSQQRSVAYLSLCSAFLPSSFRWPPCVPGVLLFWFSQAILAGLCVHPPGCYHSPQPCIRKGRTPLGSPDHARPAHRHPRHQGK